MNWMTAVWKFGWRLCVCSRQRFHCIARAWQWVSSRPWDPL